MTNIPFIQHKEFKRILNSNIEKFIKMQILSDMCRLNTLSAIKRAGSGHIGSSLSSMDLFVALYFTELNILDTGINNQHRDIFFSSKGHDAPGQYSVLAAAGIIEHEKLFTLRRLGGLEGHPEIGTPGIEANSGSLGMGISKARGMALAKKLSNSKGRVFVLTGDGELQEGQVWESLQTTAHQKINNIHVIVDSNKIQTDKMVENVVELKNLEHKLTSFGWYVKRCNGHDFQKLNRVFTEFRTINDKPKILIADTIKGKGVSFMEQLDHGTYKWHSGAPGDEVFGRAYRELITNINLQLENIGEKPVATEIPADAVISDYQVSEEKIVTAYGEALVEVGEKRKDIVVLSADLAADCGIRPFEEKFPERFIENGIAEQDMVSMAGGLALHGFLPIVHSFSVFLSARANEQIYNNSTEKTKIIYICNYAGLLPAGPGSSHQGIRDISLFGALPNCISVEPCNALETKKMLEWCVNSTEENCMIRLSIFPSPGPIDLPDDYQITPGMGTVLKTGTDATIFAYGPVMLHEALLASSILESDDLSLQVVNMPWLNRIDGDWIEKTVGECRAVFVMDNHSIFGGLGDNIINMLVSSDVLKRKIFHKFGIHNYPECGAPAEVLSFHELDSESVAKRIKAILI